MPLRRSIRDRNVLTYPPSPPTPPLVTTRLRRGAAASSRSGFREQSKEDSDEDEGEDVDAENSINNSLIKAEQLGEPRRTFRITVKMPSNRLREATSQAPKDRAPAPSSRTTRNIKKSYVVETSSEEEEGGGGTGRLR